MMVPLNIVVVLATIILILMRRVQEYTLFLISVE